MESKRKKISRINKKKLLSNYQHYNFNNKKYSRKKFKYKNKNKNKIGTKQKKLFIIFIFIGIYFMLISFSHKTIHSESTKYQPDDITLVTALYQIPTNRHHFNEYFDWVDNLLKINRSIVFFMQKNLSEIIKSKRPKIYENKTIWIESEFSELYFYQYKNEFEKTFLIDGLQFKHNIYLFIIWNEKLKFLEKAINANYFKSKFFFWIDAGYFRENDVSKYINNWPSINKCNEDPRVILNEIRKISKEEYEKLMAFDADAHNRFKNDYNIAGNAYGGRADYLIKFINYYYDVFKLFMEKEKFIGSDQNLYSIVSYLHPEIIKKIYSKDYQFLKSYYLDKK